MHSHGTREVTGGREGGSEVIGRRSRVDEVGRRTEAHDEGSGRQQEVGWRARGLDW